MGLQLAKENRRSSRVGHAARPAAGAPIPVDRSRQAERILGNQNLSRLNGTPYIQRKCACGAAGPGTREAQPGAMAPADHAPRLQTKLAIGAPGDAFEQEADRVADQVMRMPADPTPSIQRTCSDCSEEEIRRQPLEEEEQEGEEIDGEIQAKAEPGRAPGLSAPAADRIASLNAGRPLSASERAFFEPRFGYDFSRVQVLDDGPAAAAAASIQARAFTKGQKVVFGSGQRSRTPAGLSLMAHELTHVIQQGHAAPLSGPPDAVRPRGGADAPRHAMAGRDSTTRIQARRSGTMIQRAMLCSKRLEAPVLGWFANHAYVDNTGRDDCQGDSQPGNLAIQTLHSGNFLRGCAVKTDRSTDPQGRTPNMKPCDPKPGVSNVSDCLNRAFSAYADPSHYANPFGPNSNTFVGTLARACCANSSSRGLGWVPGWNHAPAGPCKKEKKPSGSGGQGQGTVQKVRPRPFRGGVWGSFRFWFNPPQNPKVGKVYVLTLHFKSNGKEVASDVPFRLVSVDKRGTMRFKSTNTVNLNIAPVGDQPKIIRVGNHAQFP